MGLQILLIQEYLEIISDSFHIIMTIRNLMILRNWLFIHLMAVTGFLMKEIICCFMLKEPGRWKYNKTSKNTISSDITIPIQLFISSLQALYPGKVCNYLEYPAQPANYLHQNQMLFLFMRRKMKILLNQEENGLNAYFDTRELLSIRVLQI